MKSRKELGDLRKVSDEELNKELNSACESLFKLRFQKVIDEMVDTSIIRKTRKKVARIRTLIRERELQNKE